MSKSEEQKQTPCEKRGHHEYVDALICPDCGHLEKKAPKRVRDKPVRAVRRGRR